MVTESPKRMISGPPFVSTRTSSPTLPRWWATAADAVAPVPQLNVSASTPRSNVRILMVSPSPCSTKLTFAPSTKVGWFLMAGPAVAMSTAPISFVKTTAWGTPVFTA